MGQPVDQCFCLIDFDVESVVNDLPGRIDNDGPGGAPRAVGLHDLRCLMGVGIAGCMRHGDLQGILDLVLPEFVRRVETIAFEYGLNGEKFDLIVVCVSMRYLLQCWEPQLAAPRSPVLEKIEENDFTPIVPQPNGRNSIPVAANPCVQLQLRRCTAQYTVF